MLIDDDVTLWAGEVKDMYEKAKSNPDKEAALNTFFSETMPKHMELVEKSLPAAVNGVAALVGNALSIADVALLVLIRDFFDNKAGAEASIQRCPRLMASLKATEQHPSIATYRTSRTHIAV
jgi:glutathione S-transferase